MAPKGQWKILRGFLLETWGVVVVCYSFIFSRRDFSGLNIYLNTRLIFNFDPDPDRKSGPSNSADALDVYYCDV